jgi:glyoxylase-like metal-dependent hydrolase (beta-lactamase superfamily II)
VSEPVTRATHVEPLLAGVWHWTLHDERIDFRSDAYAVVSAAGRVLIDPLPLTEASLAGLGRVEAICLTGGFHQRAAWSLREQLQVPVHAPKDAANLLEPADVMYEDDGRLPGALRALRRPGPTGPHYVLQWDHGGERTLFIGDLLMRAGEEPLRFVPDEHQDDPERSRESVRGLIELDANHLCPAHGRPIVGQGAHALQMALALDAEKRAPG